MAFALVSNGTVVDFFPGGDIPSKIRLPNGDVVYGAIIGEVSLQFSILPVSFDEQPGPTSYQIGEPSYSISDEVVHVTRTWVTPEPQVIVPRSVTNAQARAVLMQTPSPTEQGKTFFQSVDAYCVAQGGVIDMAWNWVNEFTRNGTMVGQVLKAQFSQTDEQIDQLFIAADQVVF